MNEKRTNRILKSLCVVIGLLGFSTLIPGVVDNTFYYYYRIINGGTIKFKDDCYTVPDGWFKGPGNIENGCILLKKNQ